MNYYQKKSFEIFNGLKPSLIYLAKVYFYSLLLSIIVYLILFAGEVNLFEFQQLVFPRTLFVIWFLICLTFQLFSFNKPHELLLIFTLSFLSHYYHLVLGGEIQTEPTNILRIIPFIMMFLFMFRAICLRYYRLSQPELLLLLFIFTVGFVGWYLGRGISSAAGIVFFFVSFYFPIFYFYIKNFIRRYPKRVDEIPLAALICFFLLIVGYFITFTVGLDVRTTVPMPGLFKATDMSDFNTISSYMILLWPFALHGANKIHIGLVAALIVTFVAVSIFGMSRTMILLLPFLLLASLPYITRKVTSGKRIYFYCLLILLSVLGTIIIMLLETQSRYDLLSRWEGRIDLALVGSDESYLNAFFKSISFEFTSWAGRLAVQSDAFELWLTNPYFGQGWDTYKYLSRFQYSSSHSLILDILQQGGIIAGILYLVLNLFIVIFILKSVMNKDANRSLALLYICAIIIWNVDANIKGATLWRGTAEGMIINGNMGMLFILYLRKDLIHLLTKNDHKEIR